MMRSSITSTSQRRTPPPVVTSGNVATAPPHHDLMANIHQSTTRGGSATPTPFVDVAGRPLHQPPPVVVVVGPTAAGAVHPQQTIFSSTSSHVPSKHNHRNENSNHGSSTPQQQQQQQSHRRVLELWGGPQTYIHMEYNLHQISHQLMKARDRVYPNLNIEVLISDSQLFSLPQSLFDPAFIRRAQAFQNSCTVFFGVAIVSDPADFSADCWKWLHWQLRQACIWSCDNLLHQADSLASMFSFAQPPGGEGTAMAVARSVSTVSNTSTASSAEEGMVKVQHQPPPLPAGKKKPLLSLPAGGANTTAVPLSSPSLDLLPTGFMASLIDSPSVSVRVGGALVEKGHSTTTTTTTTGRQKTAAVHRKQQENSSQPATIANSLQTSPHKTWDERLSPPAGISPVDTGDDQLPPSAITAPVSGNTGCDLLEPGPSKESVFRPISPNRIPAHHHAQRLVLNQPASCKLVSEVYSMLYSLYWFLMETREDSDSVMYRMPIALGNLTVFYHKVALPTLESLLNAPDKHLAGPEHSADCPLSPDLHESSFNFLMEEVQRFLARATCFRHEPTREVKSSRLDKEGQVKKLARPAFKPDPSASPVSSCLWFEDSALLLFKKAEASQLNILPLKQEDLDDASWDGVPCYEWGGQQEFGGAAFSQAEEEALLHSSEVLLPAAPRLSDPTTVAPSRDASVTAEDDPETSPEVWDRELGPDGETATTPVWELNTQQQQALEDPSAAPSAVFRFSPSSFSAPAQQHHHQSHDPNNNNNNSSSRLLGEPPFATLMIHDTHSFCTTDSVYPNVKLIMPLMYKLGVQNSNSNSSPTRAGGASTEEDDQASNAKMHRFLPSHGRENFDITETRRPAFIKLFSIFNEDMLQRACPKMYEDVKNSVMDQQFRERDLSFSRISAPVDLESEEEAAVMCNLTAVSLVEVNEQNHRDREDLSHLDLKIVLVSSNAEQIRGVMAHCIEDTRRRPLCVFTALDPEGNDFLQLAEAFAEAETRCECLLVNVHKQVKFNCVVQSSLPQQYPALPQSEGGVPTTEDEEKQIGGLNSLRQTDDALIVEEENEELKEILPPSTTIPSATNNKLPPSTAASTTSTTPAGPWGVKTNNKSIPTTTTTTATATPMTSTQSTPCPTPTTSSHAGDGGVAAAALDHHPHRPKLLRGDFHQRLSNKTGNEEWILVQCRSRQLLLKASTKEVLIPGKDYVIVQHQYPIRIDDVGLVLAATLGLEGSSLPQSKPKADFDPLKSWTEDWPTKLAGHTIEPKFSRRATQEEIRQFRQSIPVQEARILSVLVARENRRVFLDHDSQIEVKSCTLSLNHERLDVFVKAHRSVDNEWMKTTVMKMLKKQGGSFPQPSVVYTQRLWFGESFARVKENLSERNVYYPPPLETLQQPGVQVSSIDKRFPLPLNEAKIAVLQEERLQVLYDKAERRHNSSVAATKAKLSQAELPSLPSLRGGAPATGAAVKQGGVEVCKKRINNNKPTTTTTIVFEKNAKK